MKTGAARPDSDCGVSHVQWKKMIVYYFSSGYMQQQDWCQLFLFYLFRGYKVEIHFRDLGLELKLSDILVQCLGQRSMTLHCHPLNTT